MDKWTLGLDTADYCFTYSAMICPYLRVCESSKYMICMYKPYSIYSITCLLLCIICKLRKNELLRFSLEVDALITYNMMTLLSGT